MNTTTFKILIFLTFSLISSVLFSQDENDSVLNSLPFPIEQSINPSVENNGKGIDLNDPSNVEIKYEYNEEKGTYSVESKIGDFNYKNPTEMTMEEYLKYSQKKQQEEFFKKKIEENNGTASKNGTSSTDKINELDIGVKIKSEEFDRIFGGNRISMKPQGSAEIKMGVTSNKTDNPAIPVKNRRLTTFDFDQNIQVNIVGSVGEKLKISTNYDTKATFDFQNQVKIEYTGDEDEIIKSIEAGNVALPLNSSLITGSQGLFGIKTKLQFGRLTSTVVFSQQKSEKKSIEVKGGAQVTDFEIDADSYEANRHYFLSMYFYDNYDATVSSIPVVPQGALINRVEVWVTNTTGNFEETRNVIGFTDLGENPKTASNSGGYSLRNFNQANLNNNFPDNLQNDIYTTFANDPNVRSYDNASLTLNQPQSFYNPTTVMEQAVDYEKISNARKLTSSEYTVNTRLGFISLNQSLNNDEMLAVAYEYTDKDGKTHQVGEFSTDGIDGANALLVKLLKGTLVQVNSPLWRLMMKNVYNIGAYQLSPENFILETYFRNPNTGSNINYLPVEPINGLPLLQVLNFDRLNANQTNSPDGFYDFVDNASTSPGTMNSRNGRVYLPATEPFGSYLEKRMQKLGVNQTIISQTVFTQLYDSTKAKAQQFPEFDRYSLKGKYQSSSGSEIPLNSINVPEGSVTVTAGGATLTEGVDYTVDYMLGRVKILNTSLLESNTPINVDFESNSLFNIQTKTLIGANFEYEFSKKFHVGGTVLKLSEKPLTQKVNVGSEPVSNTIAGVNFDYATDAPWLTNLVDKIPGINTKAKSSISLKGEFAYLIPGQPKYIGSGGISYIDDFESSQSSIDIKSSYSWKLASTPMGQPDLFPEGSLFNDLAYNFNRASLSWYSIDPLFFRNNAFTPENIRGNPDVQNDQYQREVFSQELYPNREFQAGTPTNIRTLDLYYRPSIRGQYNYDTTGGSYSSGVNTTTGELNNPDTRWGGITRALQTTDFELSNVEYIQFWVMDPFDQDAIDDNHDGEGTLYLNLGNISEDVLRDDKKAFENGLPTDASGALDISGDTESTWGKIPTGQQLVQAFDTDPQTRQFQDAGLDGLINEAEDLFFNGYKNWIQANVSTGISPDIVSDLSSDDYKYYLGDDYDNQDADVLERYTKFNNQEGNSEEQTNSDLPTAATSIPDVEDINGDFVTSTAEQYYQYEIELKKSAMVVGQNYIVDEIIGVPANSGVENVKWYQFKVPISNPDKVVGSINDFRSIRFMRMFLAGFDKPVVVRFGSLELIRGDWRRYTLSLEENSIGISPSPDNSIFAVSAVNIEENSSRKPIPYVIPPDIQRELQQGTQAIQLNEQSIQMEVFDLRDGDAKAIFKDVPLDVRSYKKMKMYVHLEEALETQLNEGDLTLFVRFGSDYSQNFYEYEFPMAISPYNNSDPYAVWPEENNVEIEFEKFTDLKVQRDQLNYSLLKDYIVQGPNGKQFKVRGNPNMSELKNIMIGIRNPSSTNDSPYKPDDGLSKSGVVWINELRLTDFINNDGWATVGQMNAKLADFADVSVSGRMSTPGWGSIEEKVSDRQRETIKGVDAQTTIQLGKFANEDVGLRLPLFMGFSQEIVTPQYDPQSGDITTDQLKENLTPEEYNEKMDVIQEVRTQKSVNLVNVGIAPITSDGQPKFYDPSNLTFNYSYSESTYKDYFIENDFSKNFRYGLSYRFANKPKNYKPFSKSKFLRKSNWFKIVRETNFYLAPKTFGFETDFNRTYTQRLLRPLTTESITTYQINKKYTWNRTYTFGYDLAKNIKFNFDARNTALIGEPEGLADKSVDADQYQQNKDSIWRSIQEFGINTGYNHNYSIKVQLPLDQIPMLQFLSSSINYSAGYQWRRMALLKYSENDSLNPFYEEGAIINPANYTGNTIENSRSITYSAKLNFSKIYNKVKFFREADSKFRRQGKSAGKKDKITAKDYVAKFLMMMKNASGNYTITDGIFLPGYTENTQILGMNQNWSAPGFGFVAGQQNYDIFGNRKSNNLVFDIANKGYIVKGDGSDGTFVDQMYSETHSELLSIKGSLEPLPDLKIDLKIDQKYSENRSSFFRYLDDINDFGMLSPSLTGNYSISFISIGTSFSKDDAKTYENETFNQFSANREIISAQLGEEYGTQSDTIPGYYQGFGPTSQNVVISSFVSTYGNKKVKYYDPIEVNPLPNWQINYKGLSKLKAIQKIFKNFSISHGYNSEYSVSSFSNILQDSSITSTDLNGDFWSLNGKQINTVLISERFSPLIGVDMETNNKLLFKVEYKKDRNLLLNLANNQLTETKGTEYTLGAGYRIPNVKFPFATQNPIKSDLALRFDFSYRYNSTIARKLVENSNQITGGQKMTSYKFSADYSVSQFVSVRFYFDLATNKPLISNSFPTSNSNGGISLRLTL